MFRSLTGRDLEPCALCTFSYYVSWCLTLMRVKRVNLTRVMISPHEKNLSGAAAPLVSTRGRCRTTGRPLKPEAECDVLRAVSWGGGGQGGRGGQSRAELLFHNRKYKDTF